ncbi:hypothetical protein B0H17DRAFT_1336446 [Mycena rosella]|uniref:Uncharacterized protein n=1 Tax=Mycena rosella TaxID=1033263 RepID=A0AAD7CVG0_MYCRO|nr:hypothetical protein B0H17DRAFT_1336446 [Mycena rosella]
MDSAPSHIGLDDDLKVAHDPAAQAIAKLATDTSIPEGDRRALQYRFNEWVDLLEILFSMVSLPPLEITVQKSDIYVCAAHSRYAFVRLGTSATTKAHALATFSGEVSLDQEGLRRGKYNRRTFSFRRSSRYASHAKHARRLNLANSGTSFSLKPA